MSENSTIAIVPYYVENKWEFGWEAAGVISTGILSLLLLYFTVRVALYQNKVQKQIADSQNKLQKQIADHQNKLQEQVSNSQNELQERIADSQNKLQKQIADRDVRMQNYQHRVKVYLQIFEAFDFFIDAKVISFVNLEEGKNLHTEMLKKLSQGRNLMLKSLIEAELLFSSKLVGLITELHNAYFEHYTITSTLIDEFPDWRERFRELAISKDMASGYKMIAAIGNPSGTKDFESIISEIPEFAPLIESGKKLTQKFLSAELRELFLKETRVEIEEVEK
ncbi:MAG: hypothetical protein FWF24_02665 [Alphaproteobacteria bacterium]|nr:hypothetical protein [Alphaproteobacteria bacterium]